VGLVLNYDFVYKLHYYIYLFIYFAVPPIAPQMDAPSEATFSDTADPATDPIAPSTYEPTVEAMVLLFDPVPLSPDAMSVNTQQHSYVRYKILTVMNMKLMVL
jgi:hypothetical protein